MKPQAHVHFVGKWPHSEKVVIEESVQHLQKDVEEVPESVQQQSPWICLLVEIKGCTHYLGYKLGDDAILRAVSAHRLAQMITPRVGEASEREDSQGTSLRGGMTPYRLRKAVHFVRTNIGRPITLADMAAEAQMTTWHFARMFKQSLELTPLQYLTQCRIEEATWLLRTTDLKVIDVCKQVGYQDQSSFAALFRRHTGMTPCAYRREHR